MPRPACFWTHGRVRVNPALLIPCPLLVQPAIDDRKGAVCVVWREVLYIRLPERVGPPIVQGSRPGLVGDATHRLPDCFLSLIRIDLAALLQDELVQLRVIDPSVVARGRG